MFTIPPEIGVLEAQRRTLNIKYTIVTLFDVKLANVALSRRYDDVHNAG